ncbi:MAG: hypothetical protein AB7S26_42330 [Sandaracinaceae bacterium]
MIDRVPAFFLLVPGPWRSTDELVRLLQANGFSCTVDTPRAGEIGVGLVEDDQLVEGFRRGRRGFLPEDVVAAVAACPTAALLEIARRFDEVPHDTARLARVLREAGGVAVRMESSGAASEWEPWIADLELAEPMALCRCALLYVAGPGRVSTVGMHCFDLPDAEILIGDVQEDVACLEMFQAFQLHDGPVLASGHTFRPSEDVERRVLERWPDGLHASRDGRYNPFGVWRMLPPGATGLTAGELVATIIPPLVTTLFAVERAKGPLTQADVEALVRDAPAMMLPVDHARKLERARGYADIEPELAWPQWQMVRAAHAAS